MYLGKRNSLLTGVLFASFPVCAYAQTMGPPQAGTARVDNASSSGTTASAEQPAQATAVTAQSDNDTGRLSEITVTARRLSESQQSVPIAITAFDSKMLQQLSIDDTIDLSGRAPNVQIVQTGAGAGSASVFIRGIGNNALGFNLENPVGVYVDDVYMPRLQGALLDLIDLQRVEILRGPQGTLYGRNSTVGALKYVSKDPDLYDFHLVGKAVLGNYNRHDILLGASIPIIPGELAIKVDASSRNEKGYEIGVDSAGKPDGQRGNGVDRQSGRISILWTPGEHWRVNYIADISHDDSGSTIPTVIAGPNGSKCNPAVAACTPLFGSDYKTGINLVPFGYAHSWGQSLHVEYDLGWATLKSITAYRELKALDVIDQTRIPGEGVLLKDLIDQNQTSEEVQLASNSKGRFKWVGGVVYFREHIDHNANLYTTQLIDDAQLTNSYGAYVNLTYELLKGLHIEAGGRYSYEKLSIGRVVSPIGGGAPYLQGNAGFSETKPTYKVGIDYTITPGVMVYASHSTGFRAGSFASTYGSPRVAAVVFGHTGAETAVNNEIGLKSEWLQQRLRANLTLFDTKYNNLQTQATTIPYNVYATDFRFKGVEVELEARPMKHLSMFANGSYLDARTLSGTYEGMRPRLTPKFQYSIGAEYRVPVSDKTQLFANINDVYTAKYTTDPSDVSSATQGAYSLLGANVGADLEGGRYRVSVGGKNLTNVSYFNGTSLNVSQYFGQPRTVFVEFEVKL